MSEIDIFEDRYKYLTTARPMGTQGEHKVHTTGTDQVVPPWVGSSGQVNDQNTSNFV